MGYVRIGVLVLMIIFLSVAFSLAQDTAWQIWINGVEHAAQGNFKEAKVEFAKAIEVDPFLLTAKCALKVIGDTLDQKVKSKTAIHLFKGIACVNKGQLDESITEINKAIDLDSSCSYIYVCRGFSYGYKGQYDKAISDFSKAIEINPKYAMAYNNRGAAYYGKGQYDKAISDYSKAIELNPKYAMAYKNRGLSYYLQKEYRKAWEDVLKAQGLRYKVHP